MRIHPDSDPYRAARGSRSSWRRTTVLSGAAATVTVGLIAFALSPSGGTSGQQSARPTVTALAEPAAPPHTRAALPPLPSKKSSDDKGSDGKGGDDKSGDKKGDDGAGGGSGKSGLSKTKSDFKAGVGKKVKSRPRSTKSGSGASAVPGGTDSNMKSDAPGEGDSASGTDSTDSGSGDSGTSGDSIAGNPAGLNTNNANNAATQREVRRTLAHLLKELLRQLMAQDNAGGGHASARSSSGDAGTDQSGSSSNSSDNNSSGDSSGADNSDDAGSSPDASTTGGVKASGVSDTSGGGVDGSAGGGQKLEARLTGFAAPDNNPAGSKTISEGVLHGEQAGGTGTFKDPITAASPGTKGNTEFPAGTKFYLPSVHRYVIVEDSGATKFSQPHLDVWNGDGPKSISDGCESGMTGKFEIIKDPPPGLPVDQGPIADKDGCHY